MEDGKEAKTIGVGENGVEIMQQQRPVNIAERERGASGEGGREREREKEINMSSGEARRSNPTQLPMHAIRTPREGCV